MAESLRFLIADDEALHNLALTSQLEALGHQVVATASNGQEAVELAREKKPDMAILDIRMPVMKGPTPPAHPRGESAIPIIILSAYSDTRTVDEATRSPIFHYLVKPVDPTTSPPPSPSPRPASASGRRPARSATPSRPSSRSARSWSGPRASSWRRAR
jgi:CheY-like chemotaxis protein